MSGRPVTSWRHDVGGLAACLAVAAVLRLSAAAVVAVIVAVAACHGWAQTSPARAALARRVVPWALAVVVLAAVALDAGGPR